MRHSVPTRSREHPRQTRTQVQVRAESPSVSPGSCVLLVGPPTLVPTLGLAQVPSASPLPLPTRLRGRISYTLDPHTISQTSQLLEGTFKDTYVLRLQAQSEIAQLCLTLCYPMNYSLPGSSVHGIFPARVLEWVATSFSRGSFPPGIEPGSPALQAHALPSEAPGKPRREE